MNKEAIVINNKESEQRFEIHTEGATAFLEYRFHKNTIALMHTWVPDALSGKGIASALAQHALEWAKEHHKRVLVYCPFVAAYLKRHPKYNTLVDHHFEQ